MRNACFKSSITQLIAVQKCCFFAEKISDNNTSVNLIATFLETIKHMLKSPKKTYMLESGKEVDDVRVCLDEPDDGFSWRVRNT
jgi:hypothetical protein